MSNTKIDVVLDNLERIKKWKASGATDEQICQALGISKTSFYKYKSQNAEISETLKKGVSELVMNLKGELARQAEPHTTTTKKSYIREENGVPVKYIEEVKTEHDGNVVAINMLLKNLDRERWKDNWDYYEFKKLEYELHVKEFELREKMAKDDDWENV